MKASNLVLLLTAVCSGCGFKLSHNRPLGDVDNNGVFRITAVADSNTAPATWRTTWIEFIQNENLLPQVHALCNGADVLENVEWANSALVGFSCVGPFWGGSAGLAWTHSAIAHNADGIVVALGTNDLEAHNSTPQDIVTCYLNMQTAAAMAHVQIFFATTPSVYPPYSNAVGDAEYWNKQITALNALVRATFEAKRIIDFDTGFTPDMYSPDGRHLNDSGQRLRAQRVVTVIQAAQ